MENSSLLPVFESKRDIMATLSMVMDAAEPFMQPELWRQLRDYDRRDFHPNDSDTTELVATWREELFGAEGALNDKLVGPSKAAA